MIPCTRPDCDGTGVVGDSTRICDVCFRGPVGGGAVGDAGSGLAVPGGRCDREGCDGAIGSDGICDVCFRSPLASPAAVSSKAGSREAPASWVSESLGISATSGQPVPGAYGSGSRPRRTVVEPPVWYLPDRESEPPPVKFGVPLPGGARSEHTGPRLGLGLVDIPRLRTRDTDDMILADPVIAELDNRCSACRAELSDDGPQASRPSLPSRCPRCDADVSQHRPLEPDEIIGHQYRIRGCVGRGGQGWVYLAHDLNLDNDPVAIKGVRDAAHQESLAAELRSLIAVKHPDIVSVRNYVQYPDPLTQRLDGYIVMEFLDGVSLAEKALAAGGRLPVGEALAYVLATLPALGYLHDAGLVYGDYKPQNIMQSGDRVKLVDLGAVTPIGPAAGGRAWATRGFAAPEILRDGPSAASDVYCVGRTLALLTAPFEMADADGATLPLPLPTEEPVFAAYESFYRLLLRATAPDPHDRFGSVGRFADQLTGVLREVVAIDRGVRSSAPSTLFTAEHSVVGSAQDATQPAAAALALPAPRPEENEPAAALLETAASAPPAEAVRLLSAAPPHTAEVAYKLALAQVALGDLPAARAAVQTQDGGPRDWRTTWYGAVLDLADGRPQDAWPAFAAIRDALPGEAAPKLALAACAEASGRYELARHYYATVWNTDDTYVGAAFGVARCEMAAASAAGAPGSAPDAARGAIGVLESIPDRLHHHVTARVEALRLRLGHPGLDLDGLRDIVSRLEALKIDDEQSLHLEIRLWGAARASLRDGRLGTPSVAASELLLGVRLTDHEIGRALERCHLLLRRYAPTRREVAAHARTARLARPRTRW